jgi:hypothetical protein
MSLGDTARENTALMGTELADPALGTTAREDTALVDTVLDDAVLGDTGLRGTALCDSALEDRRHDDTAPGGSSLGTVVGDDVPSAVAGDSEDVVADALDLFAVPLTSAVRCRTDGALFCACGPAWLTGRLANRRSTRVVVGGGCRLRGGWSAPTTQLESSSEPATISNDK